jgi:hypothetical protein
MLEDIKYLKYDNNENLIDEFYKILFNWRKEKVLDTLKGYSQLIGNAVNEEIRCYFSNEFSENEEEYFGDTGVAFYFDYPAVNEDCVVILTNKQFFQVIKEKYMAYLQDDSSKEKEIISLLDEIKEKL